MKQQTAMEGGTVVRRANHLQLWPQVKIAQEPTPTKRDPTDHIPRESTRTLEDIYDMYRFNAGAKKGWGLNVRVGVNEQTQYVWQKRTKRFVTSSRYHSECRKR